MQLPPFDRKFWRANLSGTALILILLGSLLGFGLNAPIADGRITAKVLRYSPSTQKYWIGTIVSFGLEDGREVPIAYNTAQTLPEIGTTVSLTHFHGRFFGEGFGQ